MGHGGVSLASRLDRDILAEPDVGTVIIDEGLEDLLVQAGSTINPNPAAANLEEAYQMLEGQLSGFGITDIVGTLTPCAGYMNSAAGDACTTTVDAYRTQLVNTTIRENTTFPDCYADFDTAVSNGMTPEMLAPTDNAGDDVNLTPAGYAALAPAVFDGPDMCSLNPNAYPLPSVP